MYVSTRNPNPIPIISNEHLKPTRRIYFPYLEDSLEFASSWEQFLNVKIRRLHVNVGARTFHLQSYRPIPHPVGPSRPKAPGSHGGARHASVATLVLGIPGLLFQFGRSCVVRNAAWT